MIERGALREFVLEDTLAGIASEVRFYRPNGRYYHGRQFVDRSYFICYSKRAVSLRHRVRGKTKD